MGARGLRVDGGDALMPTEIIVAVITGCITLAGVLVSNSRSQAVTDLIGCIL